MEHTADVRAHLATLTPPSAFPTAHVKDSLLDSLRDFPTRKKATQQNKTQTKQLHSEAEDVT